MDVVVHDGGLGITGSLESSNNGAAGGDVDGRDGETLLAGVGKELQHVVACLWLISVSPISAEGSHHR